MVATCVTNRRAALKATLEVFTAVKIQVEVSGLWRRVVLWYDTNVSENLGASNFTPNITRPNSPEDLDLKLH